MIVAYDISFATADVFSQSFVALDRRLVQASHIGKISCRRLAERQSRRLRVRHVTRGKSARGNHPDQVAHFSAATRPTGNRLTECRFSRTGRGSL